MKELDYGKMGMRIRQVRKAKGWSQDELAKKCGISMSFLGHIERGTRIMSLETFVSICGALDADADELLWGAAHLSEVVMDLWNLPGKTERDPSDKTRDGLPGKAEGRQSGKKAGSQASDPYAMYVRIMISVAEIMNEA